VGMALDAGVVRGGGYLFHDAAQGRYAGVVQLHFERFSLQAVGLLHTRLPGGQRGFSLLLLIAAQEFPPVNLGMGFRLTGIGGLLGLHRSAAVGVLRSGLKEGTLDSVLFPTDPVRHAARILATLDRAFPPTAGQHLIGPVGELSWGTHGALTARVGLVLEGPAPARLVLLGQLRARFPTPAKPIVRLNLDLLGSVDFTRGEAQVLATLHDSRLLEWSVSGDAAFYARWKQNPVFLLSVGGFHPAFPAPAELPPLARLQMVLSEGDRMRLQLRWYFAVTSNTLQHGAHVELKLSAAGFRIDGHLGYDTLIQLDPFGFQVSFVAGVGLKWHGHTLAAVQLEGTLSGPSPWHVQGKASFRIWRFSKSVSFDRTLGRREALPPPPVLDPLPLLRQALASPQSWDATLPEHGSMRVALRQGAGSGVRVHPLGSVAVRQPSIPLGVPITRLGSARVVGSPTYRIRSVWLAGVEQTRVRPLVDHFAPAQFQELTQAERLARPSFEEMEAGIRVGLDGVRYGGEERAVERRSVVVRYRTEVITDDGELVEGATYTPGANVVQAQTDDAAAARRTAQPGAERFRSGATPQVQVVGVGYVLARRAELVMVPTSDPAAEPVGSDERWSYSMVQGYLREYARRSPERAADLQVVLSHHVP
jgi:hypothetical protein